LNPTDLARIRQQSRLELGKVLTPAQLEEFLLRYSDTANQMREEFRGLNPTPEEFRAAFHARDSLAQQLEILPDTPENSKVRSDLAAQLRGAVRQSLGEERYELLKNNQDPLFRQARNLAAQAGAPLNVVAPIYQISQAVAAEQKRISNDATLSDEEKIAALASAQMEKARSLEQLLGTETYRRFLQGQSSK
ncbi:MAG: hypothetical protein ACR2H1_11700, partial [Limisphaerales bacterium]